MGYEYDEPLYREKLHDEHVFMKKKLNETT